MKPNGFSSKGLRFGAAPRPRLDPFLPWRQINLSVNKTELLMAPELMVPIAPSSKWEKERHAFEELRPSLLQTHQDKFVAIHEGRVVGSDDDRIALALRAYAQFGYVPMYIAHVSRSAPRTVRVPSPRKTSSRD